MWLQDAFFILAQFSFLLLLEKSSIYIKLPLDEID